MKNFYLTFYSMLFLHLCLLVRFGVWGLFFFFFFFWLVGFLFGFEAKHLLGYYFSIFVVFPSFSSSMNFFIYNLNSHTGIVRDEAEHFRT